MSIDRVQLQRFELKYLIRQELALAVRDFVRSYLELDEYGASHADFSYPVHSLYLDSDAMTTYWHTINGNKNRFKLRMRFYGEDRSLPVYCEIKRRMNEAILKQRGAVERGAVDRLLLGQMPLRDEILSDDPRQVASVQRFCQLLNEIQARPKAHVAYLREAWLSRGSNSARVTMDRNVRCEAEPTGRFCTEFRNPVNVFGSQVVLEHKFTGRFPDWCREMVRIFGLTQCSAAKYVDGVVLIGESKMAAFLPKNAQSRENAESRRNLLRKNTGVLVTPATA